MRVNKDEALKRIEARSPELCKATRSVLLAFPGSRLVQVSRSSSCIQAPEGHYLAIVGPVTATVETPVKRNFGWKPRSAPSGAQASGDSFAGKKVESHGLRRKAELAHNGYIREIE